MATDARLTPPVLADRYRARMARRDADVARTLDRAYRRIAAGLDADASALLRRVDRAQTAGATPEQVMRAVQRSAKYRAYAERYREAAARWAGEADTVIQTAVRRGRAGAVRDTLDLMVSMDLFPAAPSIPEDVIAAALSLTEPDAAVSITGISPGSAEGQALGRTIRAAGAAPPPPVRAILTEYGPRVAQDSIDVLIDGIGRGQNPRVIGRRMREVGLRPLHRARTIARTEVLRAYRDASRAAWSENPGVVQGWRWFAALDARTCASCLAQHGGFHPVTETMATHPNCRCVMVPVPAGRDTADTREWSEAGDKWLARQPEDVQRKVLGAGGARAFRGGKVRLRDYVRRTDNPVWGPGTTQAPLRDALQAARERGVGGARQLPVRAGSSAPRGLPPAPPARPAVPEVTPYERRRREWAEVYDNKMEDPTELDDTIAILSRIGMKPGSAEGVDIRDGRLKPSTSGHLDLLDREIVLNDLATTRPGETRATRRSVIVHETAHMMDTDAATRDGGFLEFLSETSRAPHWQEWREAVTETDTIRRVIAHQVNPRTPPEQRKYAAYLMQGRELWARCIQHYVMERGDAAAYHSVVRPPDNFRDLYQWTERDFSPRLMRAIEAVLKAEGWMDDD